MKHLREDLSRYFFLSDSENFLQKAKVVLFTQGIWAIVVYRIGRYFLLKRKENRIKALLFRFFGMILSVAQKIVEIMTGISIPFTVDIGPGMYIGHFGSVIVNSNVKIGCFCNLSQNITIGEAGRGTNRGAPTLKDFVWIGPGAKIFGKIVIGSHVVIGANAVANKSLPDSAVAVGVPCKIVNHKGSNDFINIDPKSLERIKRWYNVKQ